MSLYERFKAFLNKAFKLVPKSDEAQALRDEMLDSLMSKANEYAGMGVDDDIVFERCVEALGDYASAINSLKRHPINVIRDPRFQRRVLLKVSVALFAVTVYLIFSAVFNLWGTLALIIFPTLVAGLYIWSTAEVLHRNFKLKRHSTTSLILCGYAVILITALFFIIWAVCGVSAKFAWVVFPYIPVLCSVITMIVRRVLRKKKIYFFSWCVLIMSLCVAVFLTAGMLTGLWHPLWIITVLGLVICGFMEVWRLSGRIRTEDDNLK